MNKKIFLALVLMMAPMAQATSIDWTGGYRVEYTEVDRPGLADLGDKKAYGLNYLYLQPRIVASDGINIMARFDVFSNTNSAYKNSQLGAVIGGGLSDGNSPSGTGSNANASTSESSLIRVSQLYMNVNHEYGSLLVGRAPVEFGMGITHNAGRGMFDHWLENKDLISYRFVVDNVSFAPMMARTYQKNFGQGNMINEMNYILEYNNREIGARAGVFHSTRTSSISSNDTYTATPQAYPNATSTIGGIKLQTVNIFLERKWSQLEFRLEGSFLTGNTGVAVSSGEEIKVNAYAVAGEVLMPAAESKYEWSAKFGVVSGDNGATPTVYEGYQLNQNYDVAILLFNHRMGQADILSTGLIHANDTTAGLSRANSADDEAIGNAMYLAPSMKYLWDDKLDLRTTAIYAQAVNNPNNYVDFKKDLGLELDMELIYRPRERVTWTNGLGLLFPGSAWKAGSSNNYDNKINYGITTKAAITF